MKLISRRNRKKLLSRLTKILTMTVIVIEILGSSLQPTAAQSIGEKIICIDLGTTQSVVIYTSDGKTIIIPNDKGNRFNPSFVGFSQSEILIGDTEYNQIGKNPKL
eukprot:256873_1